MFKKWLASMGIGNAKVDTQLETSRLVPGEAVRGKVVIQGGKAAQQIERINLFVMTEVMRERDDRKVYEEVVLDSFSAGDSFTIGEGEHKELDFQFTLPLHTPPTLGNTQVWIQTGMDVPNAIDPNDRDAIHVNPHPYMDTVLEALTDGLGFRLQQVEMEYSKGYRYVQEFEFLPGNEFRKDLDELEVVFFMEEDRIELILEVDRRAKGLGGLFAEATGMDESYLKVAFAVSELEEGALPIAEKLRKKIDRFT